MVLNKIKQIFLFFYFILTLLHCWSSNHIGPLTVLGLMSILSPISTYCNCIEWMLYEMFHDNFLCFYNLVSYLNNFCCEWAETFFSSVVWFCILCLKNLYIARFHEKKKITSMHLALILSTVADFYILFFYSLVN